MIVPFLNLFLTYLKIPKLLHKINKFKLTENPRIVSSKHKHLR